jgi:hypothetical protein
VSFTRFKGVVNTMDGAHDITRKKDEARLPPKGERKGAHVVGFDTLPHAGSEARAAREAREAAAAPARAPAPKPARPVERPTGAVARLGGGGGGGGVGGGGGGADGGAGAATAAAGGAAGGGEADRGKRAAYFERMFAEQAAKKKGL